MTSQVDPRGLRFAAALTSIALAIVLVTPSPVREIVLGLQVVVFAVAVAFGVHASPYGAIFRAVVRPRIGASAATEDARPPRFAQLVGLIFTASALLTFALGSTALGLVLTAFALIAALLNATVGLCLGCELYLTWRRIVPAPLTRT